MSIQSSFNSALSSISQLYQLKKMAKAAEKGEKRATELERANTQNVDKPSKLERRDTALPNSLLLYRKFPEIQIAGEPNVANAGFDASDLLDKRASGAPVRHDVMTGLKSNMQASSGAVAAALTQDIVGRLQAQRAMDVTQAEETGADVPDGRRPTAVTENRSETGLEFTFGGQEDH